MFNLTSSKENTRQAPMRHHFLPSAWSQNKTVQIEKGMEGGGEWRVEGKTEGRREEGKEYLILVKI